MKRFFKRVTSILAAIMMLFNILVPSMGVAAGGEFGATTSLRGAKGANQPTADYNYKSILGAGLYFGITANRLEQMNDLQTNYAVNTFYNRDDWGNAHGTTPNLSGKSAGMFYIGAVDPNHKMKPTSNDYDVFIFSSSNETNSFEKQGGTPKGYTLFL